jgi:hypothetical protein
MNKNVYVLVGDYTGDKKVLAVFATMAYACKMRDKFESANAAVGCTGITYEIVTCPFIPED